MGPDAGHCAKFQAARASGFCRGRKRKDAINAVPVGAGLRHLSHPVCVFSLTSQPGVLLISFSATPAKQVSGGVWGDGEVTSKSSRARPPPATWGCPARGCDHSWPCPRGRRAGGDDVRPPEIPSFVVLPPLSPQSLQTQPEQFMGPCGALQLRASPSSLCCLPLFQMTVMPMGCESRKACETAPQTQQSPSHCPQRGWTGPS